jgi:hypothetical protein
MRRYYELSTGLVNRDAWGDAVGRLSTAIRGNAALATLAALSDGARLHSGPENVGTGGRVLRNQRPGRSG